MNLTSIPQYVSDAKRFQDIIATLVKYGLAGWISDSHPEFVKGLLTGAGGQRLSGLSQSVRIRNSVTAVLSLKSDVRISPTCVRARHRPQSVSDLSRQAKIGYLCGDASLGRRPRFAMLRLIGNLLWLFFGGLESALGWFIACIICAISVVGIPWARACFNIGLFTLWPFGSQAVDRRTLYGEGDFGTGSGRTPGVH